MGAFAVFEAQKDVEVLAESDRSWLLRLLLGLSCASTWIGLTQVRRAPRPPAARHRRITRGAGSRRTPCPTAQFLEFNPKVYILVRTMNRAGPRVLKVRWQRR